MSICKPLRHEQRVAKNTLVGGAKQLYVYERSSVQHAPLRVHLCGALVLTESGGPLSLSFSQTLQSQFAKAQVPEWFAPEIQQIMFLMLLVVFAYRHLTSAALPAYFSTFTIPCAG